MACVCLSLPFKNIFSTAVRSFIPRQHFGMHNIKTTNFGCLSIAQKNEYVMKYVADHCRPPRLGSLRLDTRNYFICALRKDNCHLNYGSGGPQKVFTILRTFSTSARCFSSGNNRHGKSNTTGLIYIVAIFIFMLGGAYAGVPLYKVFCQATGLGGQAIKGHDIDKVEHMQKIERPILVRFNADVASSMRWNFRPQQSEVTVVPGETALAFYTAKNPTSKPIIGISTYNVLPYDAGQYFNKIQCFCFEEQRLNPNEQVDMPVFFYIDPEFAEDPKLEHVDTITLSYTFFEAREGLQLPLPGYPQPHHTSAASTA